MISKNTLSNSHIPVVEIFQSVSGEGISSGEVMTFIRTAGCNLRCTYCDTKYSYDKPNEDYLQYTPELILKELKAIGGKKILYTGGEPMEHKQAKRYLPLYLAYLGYRVRIETNGACKVYSDEELEEYGVKNYRPFYTLDLKCPGAGTGDKNIYSNITKLKKGDELKFVVSDEADLDFSMKVIDDYRCVLVDRQIDINLSPVFDRIASSEIVEFMKRKVSYFEEESLRVRLSLQAHKYIWPAHLRGV